MALAGNQDILIFPPRKQDVLTFKDKIFLKIPGRLGTLTEINPEKKSVNIY
jgi:hypothetical protein